MTRTQRGLPTPTLIVLNLTGFLGFFGFWQIIAMSGLTPPQFLPTPFEVIEKFMQLTQTPFAGFTLQEHLLSSLFRFGLGFGLAALIGIPLGLMMGWFAWMDDIISPLFEAIRFVAPIAWVPFAALWFGTGIGGPTLIIFSGAFPPCLINAYRGAKHVEIRHIEAGKMLGVSNFRMITDVLFPSSIPSIVAGLRVSAGLGWMSLVGAELIVASSGIGYLMVKGQSSISTSIVMSGMVAIGAVGMMIDVLLRRIETYIRQRHGHY
jgi:ABC-type nitrate/sulfonate/bicarbonate transport system permease component